MKNLNDTVGQLIKELDDVKQNYLDIRHENEELKKDLEIVKSNYSTGDNYLLTYDMQGPSSTLTEGFLKIFSVSKAYAELKNDLASNIEDIRKGINNTSSKLISGPSIKILLAFHVQITTLPITISADTNHNYENTILALSTSVDTILRYNGISK